MHCKVRRFVRYCVIALSTIALCLASLGSPALAIPNPGKDVPSTSDRPSTPVSSRTSNEWTLLDRGSHELETGEFEAAIEHLTAAIAEAPKQPQAYALRAYAKRQLGQFTSALDDYNAILEIEPRSATTYVDRGLLKGMLGDASGAIDDHTRAIELNPINARAYSSRGVARCISGDLNGGQQDFRQSGVLSLNKGDYELYSIAKRSEKQFCQ